MADKESLANEIGKHNVGDVVDLKILHKGEEKKCKSKAGGIFQ
jgi:hypothetical protein